MPVPRLLNTDGKLRIKSQQGLSEAFTRRSDERTHD